MGLSKSQAARSAAASAAKRCASIASALHQPHHGAVQADIELQDRHLRRGVVTACMHGDVLRLGEAAAADVELEERVVERAALEMRVGRQLADQGEDLLEQLVGDEDVLVDQHQDAEEAELQRVGRAVAEDDHRLVGGLAEMIADQLPRPGDVAALQRLDAETDDQAFVLPDIVRGKAGENSVEGRRPVAIDEEEAVCGVDDGERRIEATGALQRDDRLGGPVMVEKGTRDALGLRAIAAAPGQLRPVGSKERRTQTFHHRRARAVRDMANQWRQSLPLLQAYGPTDEDLAKGNEVRHRHRPEEVALEHVGEDRVVALPTNCKGQKQWPSAASFEDAAGAGRRKRLGKLLGGKEELSGAEHERLAIDDGTSEAGNLGLRSLGEHQSRAAGDEFLR